MNFGTDDGCVCLVHRKQEGGLWKDENCGKPICPGLRKFCSTEHRDLHRDLYKHKRSAADTSLWRDKNPEASKITNFLSKRGLNKRELLGTIPGFLAAICGFVSQPRNSSDRMAQACNALQGLKTRLVYADDPSVARQVKVGALYLQATLRTILGPGAVETSALRWECEHLIRDVARQPNLGQSLKIMDYWRQCSNPINLAKAAIAHTHLLRACATGPNDTRWREAKERLDEAYKTLSQAHHRGGHDPVVVDCFRMLTVLWIFRVVALYGGEPEHATQNRELLLSLANDLHFPMVLREATREDIHYFVKMGKANIADKRLGDACDLNSHVGPLAPAAEMSLMIPEIDLLWLRNDRDKAIERVDHFIALCHKHPTTVNIKILKRWIAEHALQSVFRKYPRAASAVPAPMALYWDDDTWRRVLTT